MTESITKKLREWITGLDCCTPYERGLGLGIANLIDQAHHDAIIAARFSESPDFMSDDDLAEHGLVRLPVDKDGQSVSARRLMSLPKRAAEQG